VPVVEAQDPACPRSPRDHLGLPPSRVRKDLGVKIKQGCCGHCDGYGWDITAPESSGLCWDCQGTGHPHTGPCTGWETFADWCHRHELDALTLVLGWAWITALLMLMPGAETWGVYVQCVPVLLGIPAWVAMGKIGDRQTLRERERSRR
jgi:hypothetical protein